VTRPGFATRTHLAQWANSVASQREFPRLLRRLILDTGDIDNVTFPAGEGTSAGDWDGVVRARESTPFIPSGLSGWEVSVERNVGTKAEDDYAKRTSAPDGSPTTDCTYVAAYLRPWVKRRKWAAEKAKDGRWKEVKPFGLDDIEAWLESAPVTWAWISEELGLHPFGLRSADRWWLAWSTQTAPALTPAVVTAGRSDQVDVLLQTLRGSPKITTVRAASLDEVQAFVVAAAILAEEKGDPQLLPRIAFVDELTAWRSLVDQPGSLILVPVTETVIGEAQTPSGHHVIVPVPGAAAADVELPPLDLEQLTAALKAAGLADEGRSRDAGYLGRRSLTALRRHLGLKPELHQPDWARPPVARLTRVTLLANLWRDGNDGDRAVLSALTGLSYEELQDALGPLTSRDDPFVLNISGSWAVVSPFDAWLLLRGQLVKDDMERLKRAVEGVFGEDDPALELPIDERWKASLLGRTRRHSSDLRRGLSRTLALLGVNGDQIDCDGTSGTDWATYLVRTVLDGANEDESGGRWASLTDVLPLLAEASPDAFMHAVRTGLASDPPVLASMFTDQADAGAFSSSSPHTGLLWALENLAWSTEYFGQAVDLLARLDAVDPGGRLSNRPFRSLESIYCPWHPETAADPAQRLIALDAMRQRHPDIAGRLMLSILPETHEINMPTHEPEFRDWKPAHQPVMTVEYINHLAEVVTRLLQDAGDNVSRWTQLLEAAYGLPPADRARIYDDLERLAGTGIDAEDRPLLWHTLQAITSKHTHYADADWALPTAEIQRMQAVMAMLTPPSAREQYSWLFEDWTPNIAGGSIQEDFHAYDAEVARQRQAAVAAVEAEDALDGVFLLASQSVVPWAVGVALADIVGDKSVESLLPSLDVSGRADPQPAHAYFARLFQQLGWTWLDTLLGQFGLSEMQQARLLWAARDFPRAWDRADELGDGVSRAFWSVFSPIGHGADFGHVLYCTERLMSVGRYAVALDFLGVYRNQAQVDEAVAARFVSTGLTELLTADDQEIGALQSWDFEHLFGLLERQREVVGHAKVASLEWAYLPALGIDPEVPSLHQEMADAPAFFVEIVSAVYRASGDESMTEDSDSRARATNGYRLLSSWSRVPGLRSDGSIDGAALRSWIDEAKRLLQEAGRLEVGLIQIGHVLAAAPADDDGIKPGEVIRDLLEDVQNDRIDEGLRTEIINSRGMTTRDLGEGGTQERKLADKYTAQAQTVADRWPRSAAILRALVASYRADARREDGEAERFRSGL
jgi:hypothetical protein